MNKVRRFFKSHLWIIPFALLVLSLVTSSVVAYYLTKQEGNNTTKFQTDSSVNETYVRAAIITYWEEVDSDNYIAKSPWKLKNNVINDKWIKIDNYYYYKGTIETNSILDGIPVGKELIDPNSTIDSLTDDYVDSTKYSAKYKIIYEILSVNEENGNSSSEIAWGITFTKDGIPSKGN